MTTDPQLVLKATPPRLQKSAVAWPRLSSEAPELSDRAVIAVQAPSGFGKTSLLAQWRREALQRGALVAWLTLDAGDGSTRFAEALAVAMRMGSGRSSFGLSLASASSQDEGDLEVLTGWLAEVADLSADTVLFLDDVHALPEATLQASLVYLMRNAPANLRIVMASRRRLGLPMEDMIAHGQFALIGVEILRLRLDETIGVLKARFGNRIDADAAARLHDITEGWLLGLQLALATIEKSTNLAAAIDTLSARSGGIERYFIECLLDRLERPQADFLTRLSLPDMLHPDLCQTLAEDAQALPMLEYLRANTPIFIEAADGEWLRIHPLAQEFLRGHLQLLPEATRLSLHARAAHWFAGRQMFEEAARHAMLAHQEELAYEFLDECLFDVMNSGRISRALEWLDQIPVAEVEKRPRLRLAAAWALSMGERHAQAARLVAPILADRTAAVTDRCEAAAISAAAAYFADQWGTAMEAASSVFDSVPADSPRLAAMVVNQQAIFHLLHGRPEQARYYCLHAPAYAAPPGMDAIRAWNHWVVGLSYLWEGQVILAEEALRSALAATDQYSGRRSSSSVMLASALAATLWECNRTQEAETVLANRLDMLERVTAPEAVIMGYLSAARLAAASGAASRAHDLLQYLFALGEVRKMPRLCIASLAEQVRIHALRSHASQCAVLADRLSQLVTGFLAEERGLLVPLVRLQAGIAQAYAALAKRDWNRTIMLLDEAGRIAESLRRDRDAIQIKLLRSLALEQSGAGGAGLFDEAVNIAETLGLKRILADTHPDLVDWSRRRRLNHDAAGAVPGVLSQSLAPPSKPTPGMAAVSSSSLLTPKEREVLLLLSGNMSNKQIARGLCIGDTTVKWHIKNLFSKLNAGSRRHVVDRARVLGILEAVG